MGVALQLTTQGLNNRPQGSRHRQAPSALFGAVQSINHLGSDVELRVDIGRILNDQVVFFSLGDLLERAIGPINHLLKGFTLPEGQIFLELPLLALEFAILLHQLTLAGDPLRLGQRRGFAFKLFRRTFQLNTKSLDLFLTR
ncbi:hypothetical protein D9M69_655000 [compost metagenome]